MMPVLYVLLLTGSGASANFLSHPTIFPNEITIGRINFFTKGGISVISNSDLYRSIKKAESYIPGRFPLLAFVDLYISVRKYSMLSIGFTHPRQINGSSPALQNLCATPFVKVAD